MVMISERLITHERLRCLRPSGAFRLIFFDIFVIFFAKIINNTENICNFVLGNLHNSYCLNLCNYLIYNCKDNKLCEITKLLRLFSYPELRFFKKVFVVKSNDFGAFFRIQVSKSLEKRLQLLYVDMIL